MDFVKGWIKVLDPDHPEKVETFAEGLMRPVDMVFSADGGLYALLRDAWVVDANFRPATGSLAADRHRSGRRRGVEGPARSRLRGDAPRRHGLLQGRDRRRQPTSTASEAPASRASSTRTAATGSHTGRATRPAASIEACPSAASRPSSSTADTATASTRRRTPSPAASRFASRAASASSPRPATASPPADGTSTRTTPR